MSIKTEFFQDNLSTILTGYDKIEFLILHSDAFKRLANKTQVYSNVSGSNGHEYRTRATHSLEVGQLAAAVAKGLNLNSGLARLFGYAHDIGHAPFGHRGQDALQHVMAKYDEVFEHNMQAERTLSVLEGIDLPDEVKYGLLKNKKLGKTTNQDIVQMPVAEVQVADKSDAISYTSGDISDALKMEKFSLSTLYAAAPFLKRLMAQKLDKVDYQNEKKHIDNMHQVILYYFANDLIQNSHKRLKEFNIYSSQDIVNMNQFIISMSDDKIKELQILKKFMKQHVYEADEMQVDREKQFNYLVKLFDYLYENYKTTLPEKFVKRFENGECSLARTVCDYVSGCDDKYVVTIKPDFYTENVNDNKQKQDKKFSIR